MAISLLRNQLKRSELLLKQTLDGTFVITTQPIEESEKVKNMEKFAEVLHIFINKTKKDL